MREYLVKNRILDVCYDSILFKNIKKDEIEEILSLLTYTLSHFNKDDLVISEGDYVDYLGILVDGEVISCKYCVNGNESIMSRFKPRQVVALDVFCTPKKKSYYNVYATKESYLLKINSDILEKTNLISDENKLIILNNIVTCLANESAKMCHKIEIISQKNIRSKIMSYLLVQQENNKSNKFKINFDRDQLASYLCVNRSVLSHELSLMQQDGIIKFHKNEFEIL